MADRGEAKIGRPSSFTQEMADAICERIADGESLRSICGGDDMPAKATVFRWLAAHESFRDQYARAKEAQAEALADEIVDIADDGQNDWMERNAEDNAGWVANGEALQRSRLRVDARKWVASKLLPKKYGDAVKHEHSGPDGGPIQTIDPTKLSTKTLAELLAARNAGPDE